MLGTAVALAGTDEVLFSGRVSLRTHAWLADHRVLGVPVLPAAAVVEAVVQAGDLVGARAVAQLDVTGPLVLPEEGEVLLQLRVGAPDESGRRPLALYARSDEPQASWAPHAEGLYDAEDGPSDVRADEGAAAEHTAEVRLPDGLLGEAAGYGLHPALLDAAVSGLPGAVGTDTVPVAAQWRGVRLHATGATVVRVRATRTGERSFRLDLADAVGDAVASVASVTFEEVPGERFAAVPGGIPRDALFRLDWLPADLREPDEPSTWTVLDAPEDIATAAEAAVGAGADAALLSWPAAGDDTVTATHSATRRALDLVRGWLADDRLEKTPLLVLTSGAVATTEPALLHVHPHPPSALRQDRYAHLTEPY
ncbi:polyketide synthase dehydratase domain-containing protein [Streptomyces capitiformicae]|uniref:polyketide synthase dehydratase domain-containing protein n=1 Tax=Streptomyces capitiformicae TaxID=2014920 RepID=UPI001AD83C34|nr:polyketide synthase dehydratase domain-containing protein [Streptomyces capitiformicae]